MMLTEIMNNKVMILKKKLVKWLFIKFKMCKKFEKMKIKKLRILGKKPRNFTQI